MTDTTLDNIKVTLVSDTEEAYQFYQWMSEQTSIAIDSETTGLDTYTDRVRVLQFGNDDEAWVIPIEGTDAWGGLAVDVLKKYNGPIIMHHAKYDVNMIDVTLGYRIDISKVQDTMLMARVSEPLRPASLKVLSSRYVDSRAMAADRDLHEKMKAGGHTWATVPLTFEPYWYYAGLDTILTHRLASHLRPAVAAEYEHSYQLELAAAQVCGMMERHGALIDHDYTVKTMNGLNDYVAQVADWTMKEYGVKAGANADIVKVLTDAGFEFTKATKMGAVALDKEVLSGIDHPLATAVLARRQSQKVVSAYLRHFATEVDSAGRIHPRINSCGARTGRMSMDSPNLQNLPRRGTTPVADAVRNCIVADEGHTLLMCDFSQIEWRLFASLAGSQDMVDAFQADDFFTEMARQVYNDELIITKDERRRITKNAMYAIIYGAGPEKFAKTAGISLAEAKRFSGLLEHKYPAIRRLQMTIDRIARERLASTGEAFVKSPLTGRRYAIDDDAVYKLMNYLIQGTAAEVLKLKLIELSQAGLERYMVVPVHDEVILEVPNEDLDDVAHTVFSIMNDANLFAVPVTATMDVGHAWGQKKEYVFPSDR